ncbi:MAG TPA: hypothetical protein PK447_04775 [Ignavibacteria bacterium]|nr:hypothetical protein [Ignavibacteria bacterium]
MENPEEKKLPIVCKLDDGSLVYMSDGKWFRSFDGGLSWGNVGKLSAGNVFTAPYLSKEEILSLKSAGRLPKI